MSPGMPCGRAGPLPAGGRRGAVRRRGGGCVFARPDEPSFEVAPSLCIGTRVLPLKMDRI